MIRRLKIWPVWLLFPALVISLSTSPVFAAAGESIKSFDSNVTIGQGGVATVTETITYDFGSGQRHGLFRYIPYQFSDDQGRHYESVVSPGQITKDGVKAVTTFSQESGNKIIKIGDPNKTVTGTHVYRIGYQLKPIIMKQTDGDLLRFNITGNGWDVPINSVSVALTSNGAAPTAATCYTGLAGSQSKNCLVTAVANGYQITTTTPLTAGQGLTLDAAWPNHSFASYLVPGQIHLSSWQIITLITSFFGLILLLAALIRLGLKRLLASRLKHSQTVVAQYEPPDMLSPAELGFITDEKIDLIEITATLIDLAVRGYLKITQTSPRRLAGLKPAQYSFSKLKQSVGLQPYEVTIFNALFSGGPEISLAAVDRSKMSEAVKQAKSAVEDQLKTKGFYRTPLTKTGRTLVGTGGFFALLFLFVYTNFVLAGPILLATGLLANYLVSKMRQSTQLGIEEWAKVEGFKLFLKVTEADRLRFTDAPAKTPELFSKLLPYAVALKVEQQWAKQFQGIDIAQSAGGWYYSHNTGFTPAFLASDLSNNFASAIATNFTPANTSSSGFGGGFSGGGSGGGGGGSW